MTPSLIALCLLLLAATSLAVLPVRRQIVPGIVLGVVAIGVLIWVGVENGWLWTLAALAAFASLGRNGVKQIPALIRGEKLEIPEE